MESIKIATDRASTTSSKYRCLPDVPHQSKNPAEKGSQRGPPSSNDTLIFLSSLLLNNFSSQSTFPFVQRDSKHTLWLNLLMAEHRRDKCYHKHAVYKDNWRITFPLASLTVAVPFLYLLQKLNVTFPPFPFYLLFIVLHFFFRFRFIEDGTAVIDDQTNELQMLVFSNA